MDKLGDYQLGETIETGTHTITYRATAEGERRSVLVKTFKPDLHVSRELRENFAWERHALERVDHPALATLIDAGTEEADDPPYLVFLDHRGHRLDSLLKRSERIEPRAAIAIAIAICGAMAAIHRGGDVHGALRPEVVEVSDRGTVYLHGYGTFRPGRTTVDTEALMLPEHLAPEQLLGEAADAQTDIFALGVLIYRMVTGRSPFGRGGSSITQSIRHEDPPAMRDLAARVPDKLDRVVARCLKKRRRDRYMDVGSVESDLVDLLRDKTSLPLELLASRAVSDTGLSDELPPPKGRSRELGTLAGQSWLQRLAAPLGLGLIALVLAAVIYSGLTDDGGAGSAGDPRGIVDQPALLKVLAQPWAEIHIDGELVDVTPIGRPLQVTPGTHTVVFKHPNAPDITRRVEIIAGQTILLDVEMQIVRPDKDAGKPDAASDEEASP